MTVTTELLAAYAEGNVSQTEREAVRQYLTAHPDEIQAVLFAMDDETETQTETLSQEVSYLNALEQMQDEIGQTRALDFGERLTAVMAAQNATDNLCAIRCEGIVLRHFGHNISDEELLMDSKTEGWLQTSGTSFNDIGKLSAKHGLSVSQNHNGNKEELIQALSAGSMVIAFVDEGELTGDYVQERDEDLFIGGCPDHVVIVDAIEQDTVTITDSYTPEQHDTYPLAQFLNAWEDSNHYWVEIKE